MRTRIGAGQHEVEFHDGTRGGIGKKLPQGIFRRRTHIPDRLSTRVSHMHAKCMDMNKKRDIYTSEKLLVTKNCVSRASSGKMEG